MARVKKQVEKLEKWPPDDTAATLLLPLPLLHHCYVPSEY